MKVVDDLGLLSKLLMSIKVGPKTRPLSPYEVSVLIKQMMYEGEKISDVIQRLDIKEEMINQFLSLDKTPKEFQNSVVWGESGEYGISFSSAVRINRLSDEADRKMLSSAAMNHKFTKKEIENIVTLRNKKELSIEQCIEKVKNFRPTTEYKFMFVIDLIPSFLDQVEQLAKKNGKNLETYFKDTISKSIPLVDILTILVKRNKMVLSLNKSGATILEEIMKKNKLTLGEIPQYFIGADKNI